MRHEAVPLERRESRAAVRCLSDIQREHIEWLWAGRIPRGKVSMLAGDPGLGKSMVTSAIAAAVSCGAPWPVRGEGAAPVGDVLMLSAEDDPGDTIRPRLEAAGANLKRVRVLDGIRDVTDEGMPTLRPWSLADLPDLDETLAGLPECRLVVIDPISAFLGSVDSHKNSDVRALLAPLSDLASKHKVAILVVSHLNKGSGPAIYRTSGSLAFVAAARAVYAVSKDQDDPARRLVLPVKANLAPDTGGLAYRIATDETGTPYIEWEPDAVEVDVDDVLTAPVDREARTDRQEAADWLREQLAEGPVRAKEIMSDAKALGFSERTLQRARRDIGAEARKEGFGGAWRWELSSSPTHSRQPHTRQLGENGEDLATKGLEGDSAPHSRQPATHGKNGENEGESATSRSIEL